MVGHLVAVGVIDGRARDDQRGAGLVDQEAVDLVDDGVVEAALHLVGQAHLHVVAEVVEAELAVGAVGDVGGVGLAADALDAAGIDLRLDVPDAQAQQFEDGHGELGVAADQEVVVRDDVDLLALEVLHVGRQVADDGLALAGPHLGDVVVVEDHAADELDLEVAVLAGAAGGLAAGGKGLGQDVRRRPGHRRSRWRSWSVTARRSSGLLARKSGSRVSTRSATAA